MKLFLRADNLWHEFNIYDIYEFGAPLNETLDEDFEQKYTFKGGVYLNDENENRVAAVEGLFIDEDMIEYNMEKSMSEIANLINEDVSKAFYYLEKSEIFNSSKSVNQIFPMHSCYIERFYVKPEYRGKGIGTQLLGELDKICFYMLNTHIHCFVTYPSPYKPDGGWKDDEERIAARQRMIHFFEKDGYVNLNDTGFYAKECSHFCDD